MKSSEDLIGTKGIKYKLVQHYCYYDLRKFNFINGVPIWNSLSNHVVSDDTVTTTTTVLRLCGICPGKPG